MIPAQLNGIALGTMGQHLPSHGRHYHAGHVVVLVPEDNG